jgi:hypothetical protein
LGLKEIDMTSLNELFGDLEIRSSILEVPEGSSIEAELKKRGINPARLVNLSKLLGEEAKPEGPGRDEDAAEGREWCYACQEYHPTEKVDKTPWDTEADRAKVVAKVKSMLEANVAEARILKELLDNLSKPVKDRTPLDMIKELILIKQLATINRG